MRLQDRAMKKCHEIKTTVIIKTHDKKLLEDIINNKISNLIKKDLLTGGAL
jgi:ABC-type ATPase involved in cell division